MKNILCAFVLCVSINAAAQQFLDYQLRLEPVWSRVADALGEPGSVESAEFSPNGKYIVSGTKYDNSVIMWRTSDGAELWRQYTEQEIERVGWSSNNELVAACSEDFLVTVYKAETGEVVQKIKHTQGIDGLTWSNKSMLLVSGEEWVKGSDGQPKGWIRVFQFPGGKEIAKFDYGGTVNELFFTNDDRYLLAAGHAGVKVYNTKNWEIENELHIDEKEVFTSAMFSPDGTHIVAAQNSPIKGMVHVWNWREDKKVRSFAHMGRKVESVTWHPNGEYISFAGHSPYIFTYRFSDIKSYKKDQIRVASKVWAGDHAEYIDFNKDGSFLVSAHQNGIIKLWVWMGEDPALNSNRHKGVKKIQTEATKDL